MIDLSVGIELTLDEAITSPSGFSRSSALASLLAFLLATWPRCCLDDPDRSGSSAERTPGPRAAHSHGVSTPTPAGGLPPRPFRCELSLAQALQTGLCSAHLYAGARKPRWGRATTYWYWPPHAGGVLGRRAASSLLPKWELMIE